MLVQIAMEDFFYQLMVGWSVVASLKFNIFEKEYEIKKYITIHY